MPHPNEDYGLLFTFSLGMDNFTVLRYKNLFEAMVLFKQNKSTTAKSLEALKKQNKITVNNALRLRKIRNTFSKEKVT